MPASSRRGPVVKGLLKGYLRWVRDRRHLAKRRRRRLKELRARHPEAFQQHRKPRTEWSEDEEEDGEDWADGEDEDEDSPSDTGNDNDEETSGDDMDISSSEGSQSSDANASDSAMSRRTNSDIEEESDTPLSDIDLDDSHHTLHTILRRHIETLYARRYLAPRTRITRLADSLLDETLFIKKSERPDHFRERLRLSPATFDRLVDVLELDEVFSNNSESQQAPVERQLAVALYWFGHDGNAASQQSVADWAGIGKGTVALWTRRVITAVLRPGFLRKYVRYPTDEEKEEARRWVEKHSCPAWRGGWCFVDGTLVPLSTRPFWYGDSYFDRKSRYSLNIQIISLPNLRIIDFSYGHTGSAHDATAWLGTRMARDHALFLRPGEWIWADSAYPIRFWIISPYKAPERYLPDNDEFNKVVSKLRIRSEHAIGFLKGRFWSLKNLRVVIRDAASHRFATYWIAACIAIHTFAMECEAEEKGEQEEEDPFVEQGLDSEDSDAEDDAQRQGASAASSSAELRAGRDKKASLKRKLLRYKQNREQ
ncbi:DDE Tnp4 domain-containing protein [Mycena kentingensis (nom. inval.)]|nr:DDE Tnp4 domain-containing protein [Mycena kentingensis (nom. inval.)]